MKVVILAGGLGTRLAEETDSRPKPMVEIGRKPILEHIMNIYAAYNYNEFIIACGYKGSVIKQYFLNYFHHNSDWTANLQSGKHELINPCTNDWRVSCIDTGLNTLTGGRLKRLKPWLKQESFMVTYGDGLSNVNIKKLVEFHRSHGKLATITAVRPPARFGGLVLDGNKVVEFSEKSQANEGWINGGFFVFEPQVLDYIAHDDVALERDPLEDLAKDQQLMAYYHDGFWQPMDTLREKQLLETLWEKGEAPWNIKSTSTHLSQQ